MFGESDVALLNKSTDKETVLENFRELLHTYNQLRHICIYYNGPATIREFDSGKEEAGQWCCQENETISIEEILNIVNIKT